MVNFVISDEKKQEKIQEKNRDDVVMFLSCLHGLCAFPNIVIDVNTVRKSEEEKREKKQTCCRLLLTILGYCLHGLCTFPNMVSSANIAKKSEEKREKKNRHDVDCYGQHWGSVYMVCAHFQIW